MVKRVVFLRVPKRSRQVLPKTKETGGVRIREKVRAKSSSVKLLQRTLRLSTGQGILYGRSTVSTTGGKPKKPRLLYS